MNRLTTSTVVSTRALKLEALSNMSRSFELFCLASGMEAPFWAVHAMRAVMTDRALLAESIPAPGQFLGPCRLAENAEIERP
jgi:hypothetical protein